MTTIHGFELVREQEIPEIASKARLFRHIRTGAQLLSVENDDENKSFSVGFKTPPPDDTGLPHILEHSVLNGSRKYPVKEPFVELLKTSLKTFLNAMTMPDMTIYPVASTNVRDFYNLVDVYLDAVFYPRISPEILQQEGWHHEIAGEGTDTQLTYKGVVFNEMKGYASVPEIVLQEEMRHALLPDTPYARNYGGDPAAMPNLTYEQFKSFHETYYHPSNAFIFFYGDDDPAERLRLIDDFIQDFDALDVQSELPLQPRFDAPRTVVKPFDAGEEDKDSNKGLTVVSWLLTEITRAESMLALTILSHILVDTPASPLRKALIDSGLGEDITGGGLTTYQREASFSIGLKGIQSEKAGEVETLILETLGELADNGIDRAMVESSINTIEFQLRERNTGQFPRGLMTFFQILSLWAHGGDPIDALAFEEELTSIKERYEADNTYFETLIGEHFLNNNHRVTVVLEPDPTVKEKREAAELERLKSEQAAMSESDLERVRSEMEKLIEIQNSEDSPEDLAKLPVLTLDDIQREIQTVPLEISESAGSTILYHDLPTSGIAYLDMTMDLYTLPQKYLPYIRLFGKALTGMGTASQDFVQLSQRIGANTGGIRPTTISESKKDRSGSVNHLVLRAKAMTHQTQEMLDILKDILLTVKLDNQQRFLQLAMEDKARQEAYLGLQGQAKSNARLRARFTDAGYFGEQINGISNLFFVRDLIDRIQNDWQSVLTDLETIRGHLVNRAAMNFNITLDSDNWQTFSKQLDSFIADLPQAPITRQSWERPDYPSHEGLSVPTQINFVGKGASLYDLGYEEHGSHIAIAKYLNFNHLWNRVRVQGGAYGGRFLFDPISGVATFLSWQDPNLLETLAVYDESAAFLRDIQMDSDDLEKVIIGAIGDLDKHLLPDAKGYQSLLRYLLGYTDDMRQKLRDEVLATTLDDFRNFATVLEKAAENGHVVVTSSADRLKAASDTADFNFEIVKVM